jgi:hypothetical protein
MTLLLCAAAAPDAQPAGDVGGLDVLGDTGFSPGEPRALQFSDAQVLDRREEDLA